MIWPFHPEISVPTFMTQDDFEWCVLTHKIYILWLRVHYFKGITGAPGSIPTAAIGLLLSETLFEIFSSLMCLLKAASCINIPKYYLTQNFIHFPPPTEDYLITNTSFSCPNNDFKCATNDQTPCSERRAGWQFNKFNRIKKSQSHFGVRVNFLENFWVDNRGLCPFESGPEMQY